MRNERNMYYGGPGMMPGMQPGMMPGMQPGMGGTMPPTSQMESRIGDLERQVKRLEIRISRLETPYQPSQGTQTQEAIPYQNSMQIM